MEEELQWGRGCEPADGSLFCNGDGVFVHDFNGAAGVNPRMATSTNPERRNGLILQWGRGCEPADGTGLERAVAGAKLNFNGAAGVNPRMAAALGECYFNACDFNGAAGVNPRMVRANHCRETACC